MKKSLFVFGIGILVGLGISHFGRSDQTKSVAEATPDSDDEKTFPAAKAQVELPAPPRMPTAAETKPLQSELPPPAMPQASLEQPAPRIADIDFNEANVEVLEQNIVELHKDVSLEKDRDGWIVHFHTSDNLLSSFGISNNELIRFNQVDEMKKDPNTVELANRIENLLSNLER
ncbi:MAG: hypothetical protein J7501_08410 [Bdellovibrio sp.]|nr:hypothetical protein [Bdellovibrio sp.]